MFGCIYAVLIFGFSCVCFVCFRFLVYIRILSCIAAHTFSAALPRSAALPLIIKHAHAALPLIIKHLDILSGIAALGGISMLSGIAAHSFLAALPRPAPLIIHSGIAALGGVRILSGIGAHSFL